MSPSVSRAQGFTAELTPGDYLLLCFVPVSGDGKSHVEPGMVRKISVG